MASGLRDFLHDFVLFAGRRGIVAAIFVALGAMVEGIGLILVVPLLAIVIGTGPAGGRLDKAMQALFGGLGLDRPVAQLALLLGVFGVLMLARAVIISKRDAAVAELRVGFVDARRMRIGASLATASWSRLVALDHARITNVMATDVQRIGVAAHFVLQCTVAAVLLAVQCILVLLLAPALAAIALAVMAVGAIAFMPVLRRARQLGGAQTGANLALVATTMQFLGGLKLAMSQNLQLSFLEEFRESVAAQSRRQVDHVRQQTQTRLALALLSALAGALLVLIGFGVFDIAPPTLIALLLIVARMSGPVSQLQQGAQELAHAVPAYENARRLDRDLAGMHPAARQIASGPTQTAALPDGPVVFEDVWFVHDGAGVADHAGPGVAGLSVTIAPGEFVGVTGASGVGKTTFADLLVGLFEPQRGRITVGGRVLQGANVDAWRNCVGYIVQDPYLFHDTVRRNLAWAKPQATEPEMWRVLALAGAADLVRRLPHSLDTVVGERGTLLSGGERQRLAFARAILRAPRLLVLDEATNAIDVAGEWALFETLRELVPRPAVIVIAHRAEKSRAVRSRVAHGRRPLRLGRAGGLPADFPPHQIDQRPGRGVELDAANAEGLRRPDIIVLVADHEAARRIDRPLRGRLPEHAGARLAAVAADRQFRHGAFRMMRTVVEGIDVGAMLAESVLHGGVKLRHGSFGIVTPRDAGLVRDHDDDVTGLVEHAHGLWRAGHPFELVGAVNIAMIGIEDAVPVEKRRRPLDLAALQSPQLRLSHAARLAI